MKGAGQFNESDSSADESESYIDIMNNQTEQKPLHQILKENIESFDESQSELFISAVVNLSNEIDLPTFLSILQNKEFIAALVLKINSENTQIQHNSLHAINKLISLGLFLGQDEVLNQKLDLTFIQQIVWDKFGQNYAAIFEAFHKNLFQNSKHHLKELKKVMLLNFLSLKTVEKIIVVKNQKADFSFLEKLFRIFEELNLCCFGETGQAPETHLLLQKSVLRILDFLLFVCEVEPDCWKSLWQKTATVDCLGHLVKMNSLVRLPAYKLIHSGRVHGNTFNENSLNNVHLDILTQISQFVTSYSPVVSNPNNFKTNWTVLRPVAKIIDFLIYLLEKNDEQTETGNNYSCLSLLNLETFQFLNLLITQTVSELSTKTEKETEENANHFEDQWKIDRFLHSLLRKSVVALFEMIKTVDKSNLKVEFNFWTELFAALESKIPQMRILADEDFVHNTEILFNFVSALQYIHEDKFQKDAIVFQQKHESVGHLAAIFEDLTEFFMERKLEPGNLSNGQFYVSKDENQEMLEELSGNLIEIVASCLDYKNIGKIEGTDVMLDFLAFIHTYLNSPVKNFLVAVQCVDGLMTVFADDNLDKLYFAQDNFMPTALQFMGQSFMTFLNENKNQISNEKIEFIEEVLSNFEGFLDYKLKNRKNN